MFGVCLLIFLGCSFNKFNEVLMELLCAQILTLLFSSCGFADSHTGMCVQSHTLGGASLREFSSRIVNGLGDVGIVAWEFPNHFCCSCLLKLNAPRISPGLKPVA